MRNLKKILSLALALVMTLSVMSVASATTYSDSSKISAKYAEAVDVLSGLGVFEGDDEGFRPQDNISRAEVAAIIYRAATGDMDKDSVSIYSDYDVFTDVTAEKWYAGYVNYCANALYVRGVGNNEFNPKGNVTGYELLAMILRVVGYDQNEEFSGSSWKVNTAKLAKELGITEGISETTLNKAASRELVAELLFRTLTEANIVTYTPALGYNNKDSIVGGALNPTVGEKVFQLKQTETVSIDEWGRPGYYWYARTSYTGDAPAAKYIVATEAATADASYTVATKECDVSSDIGLTDVETFTLYTNGKENNTTYNVEPLDVVNKIGAQGTLTEVYDYTDHNGASVQRIVSIDTFLAQVVGVDAATFDAAGHLKTPSKLTLVVYTQPANTTTDNDATGEYVYLTNGSTNYSYTKGQYLLVNAHTDNTWNNSDASLAVVSQLKPLSNGSTETKAVGYAANANDYLSIVGVAKTITGAQTTIWYNLAQHTVGGTTYNDAKWFKLDQAGNEITNHTWYFDSYGNLIGATNIATQYTYGVISSIWWVNDSSDGSGHANATVTYMDGTSATIKLSLIDVDGLNVGYAGFKTVGGYDNNAMTIRTAATGTAASGPAVAGEITVSTNAYVNSTATATASTYPSAGFNIRNKIVGTDLYQFETLADGSVAAYRVMDSMSTVTIKTGVSAVTGTAVNDSDVGDTGHSTASIYTNSDTQYLVLNGGAFTAVTGFTNISSFDTASSVDFVMDPANPSYAKYVFIIGTPEDGSTDFVYSNGTNFNATLLTTANGVQYYQFTYGVGESGTTNTMKVNADNYNDVITPMINGVGDLFTITYTNGLATKAESVKTQDRTSAAQTAAWLGNDVTYSAGTLLDAGNGSSNGNSAAYSYNVTSSTVVIGGTLADLATAGKYVYVIYNTDDTNKTVTHVYITSAYSSANNTVAAAKAAINSTWTDFSVTGGTQSADGGLTANVVAQVYAKLQAAGITGIGVTVTGTSNFSLPAQGGNQTGTFTIALTDNYGGSDSITGQNITIYNRYANQDTVTGATSLSDGVLTLAVTNGVKDDTIAVKVKLMTSSGNWSAVIWSGNVTVTSTNASTTATATVSGVKSGETYGIFDSNDNLIGSVIAAVTT
jgi:hypothetical protein